MNEIHCRRSQGWKSFCKPEWSKKPCSMHGSYWKKNKNKTTIGKISFCFCNRPDQPGRVVIYVGVKSIQSICTGRYALLVWNECRASFKDYGIGCVLTEIRVLPWSHCSERHKQRSFHGLIDRQELVWTLEKGLLRLFQIPHPLPSRVKPTGIL